MAVEPDSIFTVNEASDDADSGASNNFSSSAENDSIRNNSRTNQSTSVDEDPFVRSDSNLINNNSVIGGFNSNNQLFNSDLSNRGFALNSSNTALYQKLRAPRSNFAGGRFGSNFSNTGASFGRTGNSSFTTGNVGNFTGSSLSGFNAAGSDLSLVDDLRFSAGDVESNFASSDFFDRTNTAFDPNTPGNGTIDNQPGVNDTTDFPTNSSTFDEFINGVFNDGFNDGLDTGLNAGNTGNNTDATAGQNGGDFANANGPDSNLNTGQIPNRSGGFRLTGSNNGDRIKGGRTPDTLLGLAGNDVLICGLGNDAANGGGGRDRLSGDRGEDILYGARGSDVLDGAEGADLLVGGRGRNTMNGGAGRDLFVLDRGGVAIALDFNFRQDKVLFSDNIRLESVSIRQQGQGTGLYAGNKLLAILNDVQASTLTGNNFMTAGAVNPSPAA